MRIRQLEESDLPRIKEIYFQSKFGYPFPNLDDFFPIPVIVDQNDRVVMCVASLPTVELYFFGDSNWETPGMRLEAFRLIHEFVRRDLEVRGIKEVTAWIPPKIGKTFGKRLQKTFGWVKNKNWPCFSRRTNYV